jgi:predicted nucleotidyltransferase
MIQKGRLPAMRNVNDILPRDAASTLRDYKRTVEHALPGVEKVILFGSRARGEAREDSDYDVAAILRDLSDRSAISRTLSDLAHDHILAGFLSARSPCRPITWPPGRRNWPRTSSGTGPRSRDRRSRARRHRVAKGRGPLCRGASAGC